MPSSATNKPTLWSNSIAWLLAIIGIGILFIQCAEPIGSSDLWWHMALGRHILNTGQLIIDHSIFTWTDATPYHVYNSWLSEILLYSIYNNTGTTGLIILRYIIHGGFFALAAHVAITRGIAANPLTWLIIIVGTTLSFVAKLIQPEMLGFGFMVVIVWLYFTIRSKVVCAWRWWYLLPLVETLWLNTHGTFVMSAFFLLSIGLGELLNIRFSKQLAMPNKLNTHFFIALGLCIPALLLNPFGYHLAVYLLTTTTTFTSEIPKIASISGWDPTYNYNMPPYHAIDYLIAAIVIALACA